MSGRGIDPVIKLLFCSVVFFTAALFGIRQLLPNDGQMFQIIAGLLTGFAGALLLGIKTELGLPSDDLPSDDNKPGGTISQMTLTQVKGEGKTE